MFHSSGSLSSLPSDAQPRESATLADDALLPDLISLTAEAGAFLTIDLSRLALALAFYDASRVVVYLLGVHEVTT